MPKVTKSQKGIGFIGIFLAIVVFGLFVVTGYYVYNQQNLKDESQDTTSQLKKAEFALLVVGDIACDPNNPNFNQGDGKNGECRHKEVAELMAKQDSDYILLPGDIQYNDGRLEAFEQSFIPTYKQFGPKLIVAAGNHDWQTGSIEGYKNAFEKYIPNAKAVVDGKTYYSTSVGDWNIYVLDSDCELVGGCNMGSKQYEWFKAELAKDEAKCSIAMWHHPIFTSGLHRADDQSKLPVDLYELADTGGVDVVLVGHDHNYERFAKQDVGSNASEQSPRSFVVGTGGAKLRELTQPFAKGHEAGFSEHGFLKLNLTQQAYNWQFVNLSGESLDSGSDKCY